MSYLLRIRVGGIVATLILILVIILIAVVVPALIAIVTVLGLATIAFVVLTYAVKKALPGRKPKNKAQQKIIEADYKVR